MIFEEGLFGGFGRGRLKEAPMPGDIKLSEEVVRSLRCPVCRSRLERRQADFVCLSEACRKVFPVVDGIPVLINERDSVFSIQDFVTKRETFFGRFSRLETFVLRWIPQLGRNIKGRANYAQFAKHVLARGEKPRVLVLGGSVVGVGMQEILAMSAIRFVETDVAFGPRTSAICDAHDIPFEDGTFDGVIIQAVLEHVADPYRCVEEIFRVLKDGGVVYAETAFMQPVHGREYDFLRFSHMGHRRLFRRFEEIASGAAAGPGTALALAYRYFLRSLTKRRYGRIMAHLLAVFTAWPLKYVDYLVIDRPAALDAAAGMYFLGRKSAVILSDKAVCGTYRGASG
jgi:SAM-dependent methyltransferase/uncharacterized protein YbaR (Trm112 family)